MPDSQNPPSGKPRTASRGGSKPTSTPSGARRSSARRSEGRTARSSYHHGDLRQALLAATEELLDARGLEGFTLREVARRAGVSHGAPAHHFGDVRGLLSAFTAQSFVALSAAMKRRRARAGDGFDQLVAIGIAYVEFALTNRARFQLMFRSDRLDHGLEALAEAGAEAYGQLVDCIERITREAGAPAHLVEQKVALAWSIVHGFATLSIDNARFAERVSRGSRAGALNMLKRILESTRPVLEGSS